jgi:hypothetical protein
MVKEKGKKERGEVCPAFSFFPFNLPWEVNDRDGEGRARPYGAFWPSEF